MKNIVLNSEMLWKACANLAKDADVLHSELWTEPSNHILLAYGPVAQRNPFQALLYSAKNEFNVSLLPVHNLDLLAEIPWPGTIVCHFHWIHERTKVVKSESEAEAVVVYWKDLLNRIRDNGHYVAWTLHNILPHDTKWIEQDTRIRQIMADAADAVHIMTSDSVSAVSNTFKLDRSKTFLAPHPTYDVEGEDKPSRREARSQLNVSESDFVFLSFGAIMEYKGYDQLMSAYEGIRWKSDKRIRLIIAGMPSSSFLVEKIRKWAETLDEVIVDIRPIPEVMMRLYFAASDIAICPYTMTLNSGVAMMAITHGIPVIGPRCGVFLDLERKGLGLTFDLGSLIGLQDKMLQSIRHPTNNREDCINVLRELSPLTVSRSFFTAITRLPIKSCT